MTLVAMIWSAKHWVARPMNGAVEVLADARLNIADAHVVVARKLDEVLGRNGWTFAN